MWAMYGNAEGSVAGDGTCGKRREMELARERGRSVHDMPYRGGEPLQDSGTNTEEIIRKRQPGKTHSVSVVVFGQELCPRVGASLQQTSFGQASVMLILP